ncbi:ABC transporter ATP-binding protein [Hydrogenophilus thermoluteolus]|nr:ABC transporter ATP-binding protein [Hydrogenophilus thermoluteolus]MBW7656838.1 ABC transporter ATP-binding protein [Hydrogenophilus thermoluteolus]
MLLEVDAVTKRYGALIVTDCVRFTVPKGQAVGIIGPNGAGKTTLLNLISGTVQPDSGRILLNGLDITYLPGSFRCRAGIGRTYQIPHPFSGMTVFENVLVAAIFGAGLSQTQASRKALSVLEATDLLHRANELAGSLRLLDRKRLELARALATDPQLLLLDEIGGGLTELELHALVALIQTIRSSGVTILWIEHIVHALISVVDRLIAVDFGRVIADGNPEAVMSNSEVQAVYVGIDVDEIAR